MPIQTSDSVTLSEDGAGSLRADVRLQGTGDNLVTTPAGAAYAPGIMALQKRPAVVAMGARPSYISGTAGQPVMIVPGGGVAAVLTPIVYNVEEFEDDGLGQVTASLIDGQAGRLGPFDVPGYYRLGVTFHGGDPIGGTNAPSSFMEVAVLVNGVRVGSRMARTSQVGPLGPTYWRYPWTYGAASVVGALWPISRGDVVQFAVRQLAATVATGGAPGGSAARPWLYTGWAYMAAPALI